MADHEKSSAETQVSKTERIEKRAEVNLRSDVKPADVENHVEAATKEARAKKEFREQGGRTETHEDFGTPTIEGVIPGGPPTRGVERVLSPTPIGNVRTEFNSEIQEALRSLPPYLQEAMKEYQIYTSTQPSEFLNEMRNHGIEIEASDRMENRRHIAVTDGVARVQNFSEYVYEKQERGAVRFEETSNFRGTVAHEQNW